MTSETPNPCPKCRYEWLPVSDAEELCYHTAHTLGSSGEFCVTCPRCHESGPLKARPEWAVEAWNELTRPPVPDKQLTDVVEALREARPFVQRHMTASNRRECALLAKIDALAALNTAPAGDDVVERVARALAKDAGDHWFVCDRYAKENERWLKAARAALSVMQSNVA
jgi:hypothetical protein